MVLRLFGGQVASNAVVYSSAMIWWPGNLAMHSGAILGPRVRCYNMAPVHLGAGALVSQDSELCTGSHDIEDPTFPLVSRSIIIGPQCWLAAGVFVGPGVVVGEGAVLGARCVAFSSVSPWTVWIGNPARQTKVRTPRKISSQSAL
jgi:putative colanic acid biosynthesis acetyltransferase WcaF